ARNELNRHAHDGAYDLGDVVGGGARTDTTEFQRGLSRQQIVDARDAAHFADADGGRVLGRDAEVLELAPVELNTGFAQNMLEDQTADEMANDEAIRFGDFVDVVGGDQTAGAGHVFDDEGRIAGNMLAQ